MKAVIGIDTEGLYRSAINLIARLRFDHPQAELVHVDEPLWLFGGGMYPIVVPYDPEAGDRQRQSGEQLLAEAVEDACEVGLPATSTAEVGNVADTLMRVADEQHADLVAVGSTRKSKYGSFFLGSVGRGLAIGSRHSVLVAKGAAAANGKINAVFAIDYSEYSEECLRLLARMKPQGLNRLVLVTAVDTLGATSTVADILAQDARQLREHIEARANVAVTHLKEAGIAAEYRIVEGEVHDVIEANMKDVKADLLIIGAQGHGLVDRLTVGSVSLQEVVASPHSVLLLRR